MRFLRETAELGPRFFYVAKQEQCTSGGIADRDTQNRCTRAARLYDAQMSMERIAMVAARDRACASDWLIIQARDLAALAAETRKSSLLVYSALEARNAIEQLWFDILLVLHRGEVTMEFVEKVRRRRDGVFAAIREAAPEYRKLVAFSALCMQLDSRRPVDIIAWDLGRLKKWWHALSGYCHSQLEPLTTLDDPKWIDAGLALVTEVFGYFRQQMSQGATGIMRFDDMTPEARRVWDDFVAGKIDEEQAAIRLQIVRPPPRK